MAVQKMDSAAAGRAEGRRAHLRGSPLSAVPGADSLPFSLKVLLENLLRTEDGANITAEHIRALAEWDPSATRARRSSSPGAGDHAGLHRSAVHRRPRGHARGDA